MSIINKFGDCVTEIRGTGLGDCVKQFGDVVGIDLWSKSLSLGVDELTETKYKELIQNLDILPLNNIYNFEQNTPDNDQSTGSTGLKADIRQGKPEFSFGFDSGYCFHKNVYDKRGKNRWNIGIKFETGYLLASNVAESAIKGFDNGLFSVSTFKFQQGSDPEMTMVMLQFNNALELNSRGIFSAWDSLGFDGNSQNGVINTAVSFNVAPAAGTALEVVVTDECNRDVNILGLEATDFALEGVQASPTAISSVSYNALGYYEITLDTALASNDTVRISVKESGFASAEAPSGDYYKGDSPLATIS
jgi:hypothetical protein